MADPHYQDRSYGEPQKYGTKEAPPFPEMPEPHEYVVKKAEEDNWWTFEGKLEKMEELKALLEEDELKEAWLLNFYTPHTEAPRDLAKAFGALRPDMASKHWSWGFMGDMETLITRIERYLAAFQRDKEKVTGQEAVELLVDLEDRVEALEEVVRRLASRVDPPLDVEVTFPDEGEDA